MVKFNLSYNDPSTDCEIEEYGENVFVRMQKIVLSFLLTFEFKPGPQWLEAKFFTSVVFKSTTKRRFNSKMF